MLSSLVALRPHPHPRPCRLVKFDSDTYTTVGSFLHSSSSVALFIHLLTSFTILKATTIQRKRNPTVYYIRCYDNIKSKTWNAPERWKLIERFLRGDWTINIMYNSSFFKFLIAYLAHSSTIGRFYYIYWLLILMMAGADPCSLLLYLLHHTSYIQLYYLEIGHGSVLRSCTFFTFF